MPSNIRVIIPAFNEEHAIQLVIREIPEGLVNEIIVVDNNSSDLTATKAESAGAKVLHQPKKGYGNACLKGLEYLESLDDPTDIVVFLDGDHSDYPDKMPDLVAPILEDRADLVIGSRALGQREQRAMTWPQKFGNWLATRLLKLLYGVRYTDLGPFRAIKYPVLREINMKDPTFGWTVEMQLKVAKLNLRAIEIPVNYRRRIGSSKISGTLKGTIMAGYKILYTIFKYA